MEQKRQTISVITTTAKNNDNNNKSHNKNGLFIEKKKRSGPVHILRVIMHIFRFKTRKSKPPQVQAASTLYNVVGCIRPLHLQSNQSPQHCTKTNELVEQIEVYTPPLSPVDQPTSSSSASSSCGSASSYASANYDLQELGRWYKGSELDCCDDDEYDEDEEDKYFDDKCGDEMIDSKAEEFIAKFYHQMRLQQEAYYGTKNLYH